MTAMEESGHYVKKGLLGCAWCSRKAKSDDGHNRRGFVDPDRSTSATNDENLLGFKLSNSILRQDKAVGRVRYTLDLLAIYGMVETTEGAPYCGDLSN